MNQTSFAIEVTGLTRRHGPMTALDAVNLSVPKNAMFALLRPNGAGKTRLIHILRRQRDLTSVVTTHCIGEVETCDRVAIIDHEKRNDASRRGRCS